MTGTGSISVCQVEAASRPRGVEAPRRPAARSLFSSVPPEQLVEAWVEFLSRWDWQWFVTMTFRPRRGKAIGSRARLPHPEAADKLFRLWISKLNRHLYGSHWWEKGIGVRWARASESHKSGAIHYHALLEGTGLDDARRLSWKDEWFTIGGFARVEPPDCLNAVRAYCSKYVAKGGQIDFGGPLQAPRNASLLHRAPRGRDVAAPCSAC